LSRNLFGRVAISSQDTVRPQDNSKPEVVPPRTFGGGDPIRALAPRAHGLPVSSKMGFSKVERSRRHAPTAALSTGNLLYFAVVGLVATATIGVFFGSGFLLLVPSAAGTGPASNARHSIPEVRSPIYSLPRSSESDQRSVSGRPGAVTASASLPGSADAAAFSVLPPPAPPVASGTSPANTYTVQHSSDLPAAAEMRAIVAKDATSRQEAEPRSPDAKAGRGAPAGSSASAPPIASSVAAPAPDQVNHISAAEIAGFLEHGDTLLGTGDVASARLFYERAAAAGDGRAALRLAATFDPAFLGRAGLRNVQGNAAEARSWYSRALDLGAAEPKVQVNSLETKQGR
jgi:hypothetical protein